MTVLMTQARKIRNIAQKFRGSPRIYYVYKFDSTHNRNKIVFGHNHVKTVQLFVKHREAFNEHLTVYCSLPKKGKLLLVYESAG